MAKTTGIYLPDEAWTAFERLAEKTGSFPSRGIHAGQKPSLNTLFRRIGEDKALIGVIASWLNGNQDDRKQGKLVIILRPPEPKTETVAWVSISGRVVTVHFPEKRDDFGDIVKGLDYQWDAPYWSRLVSDKDGLPLDRAAELCHRLLAGGFCVCPPNVAVRDKAIAGDYESDGRRWITAFKAQSGRDYFLIRWSRREDMYDAAMRITAARYDKGTYGVRVPSEQYDQVLDFAQRHQFVLDAAAQQLAEDARIMRESALLVTLYKNPDPPTLSPERPVLMAEDFEVDNELADPHFAL